MKKFLRKTYVFFKGFGYARAAALQARAGNYEKAKALMEEYDRCK